MSKLIELIRKLGQQSQQPLGFGALASKAETSPGMALIVTGSASSAADNLDAIEGNVVDAVILSSDDLNPIENCDGIDKHVWGVGPGALSNEDVEGLVSSGCDFFVIRSGDCAGGVSQPNGRLYDSYAVRTRRPRDISCAQRIRRERFIVPPSRRCVGDRVPRPGGDPAYGGVCRGRATGGVSERDFRRRACGAKGRRS